MTSSARDDPIEVEVERLDEDEGSEPGRREGPASTDSGSYGPILAGVMLDVADLITPMGLKWLAVPVGVIVGYYVGGRMGLGLKHRLMLAAVGAAYCSLPATSKLPIGTLVGLLFRAGAFGGRRS